MPGDPIFSIFKSVFGPIGQYLPSLWLMFKRSVTKKLNPIYNVYLCSAHSAESETRTWTPTDGPYVNSRYWTGTSMQLRLMRGSLFKCKWHLISLFNDIPPHEPPLQASSSPIPRIWHSSLFNDIPLREPPLQANTESNTENMNMAHSIWARKDRGKYLDLLLICLSLETGYWWRGEKKVKKSGKHTLFQIKMYKKPPYKAVAPGS